MAIDRADWHYGGDFPDDLPEAAGGTHIGMFLAWAITRGFEGADHQKFSTGELEAVRTRKMTGREFLFQLCDEKLVDDDLVDEVASFAHAYYVDDETPPSYLSDYSDALDTDDDLPSLYHVADTWETFDKLAPILDKRFAHWKTTNGRS
jgi:hypothetical protein